MEKRLIAVIDLETGGLRQGIDEILEIGILLVELTRNDGGKWCRKVLSKFHSLVKPFNPNRIQRSALAVNRLTLEKLNKAPNPIEVRANFSEWLEDNNVSYLDVLGHNYGGFDKGFLETFLGGYYNQFVGYNDENTYALAKALQTTGVITDDEMDCHLAELAEYFGLVFKSHSALDDCFATIDIYIEMLNLLPQVS